MKLSPRCHADSEPGAAVREQKIKNFNLSGQMADDVMTVRILGELSRPMSRSLYLLSLSMPLCLWSFQATAMDPDLGQFLYAKQQQIRHFSDTADKRIPGIIWRFYDAAGVEDWETTSNLFNQISAASQRYNRATNDSAITPALDTALWPPIAESDGACEQFHEWNNRWLHRYGKEIINSIPPGSVYFGGTDPGRFIISALCESQVTGKPFFTLTQNQLADSSYLEYLRSMYGKQIKIPSMGDAQQAFEDYTADVVRRQAEGLLRPGEDVKIVDGRIQVAGPVAVMAINGLLVRKILDDNPSREFYVEESFPLEWMYPYLTPHGLIFQFNNKPRPAITEAELLKDRRYWKDLTDETLGNWLDEKTSVKELCDFAYKYGLGQRLANYPGDKEFAANDEARKCFSKLRSSLAGMYAWRTQNAADADERRRMYEAADYAFRQSYAFCPCSPEVVYRYVNLLLAHQRTDDAILIVKTVLRLTPDNGQLRDLLSQLEKCQ